MIEQEKAERFAKSAPPLRDAERDELNSLFPAYIFRRSCTGEIWTTCCHKHMTMDDMTERDYYTVMAADHQREPRNRWCHTPEPYVVCPSCGTLVIVKELRYTGRRENLSAYRRAVIPRWYRGALWARAYDCSKHYKAGYDLTGYPTCKLVGVYRFRPGLAEETSRDWWGNESFTYISRQDGPLTKRRWNVHTPFRWNSEYGMSYDVFGVEEISKSPFRYCMTEDYINHFGAERMIEFLEACCFYPRQIEMLMKADMGRVVYDLVERGVKHALAIDWSREKPTDSFGLSKQELNAFLATDRNIGTLELYKRLKRKVSMDEAAGWVHDGLDIRETFHQAKRWGIPPERLIRYLNGQVGCGRYGGLGSVSMALQSWKDYVTAAEALGYALHRDNTLMPRNLGQAHDEATNEHRKILDREREERERQRRAAWEAQEKERWEKAEREYESRRKILEQKYGYSADGYIIRAPLNGGEILDEGRILKHCVGGYAERHMRGTATILFMRQEKDPDKPWLTIEMNGNRLVQIHGFKNEGIHTAKGRFAPDPREKYREFLDTWLNWLEHGSKRDKQGKPKLPRVRQKVRLTA